MDSLSFILLIIFIGPIIGAFLGIYKKYSEGQIFSMLSFAAGVMTFVSVLELIPEGYKNGSIELVIGGILAGGLAMFLLNKILPHYHHAEYVLSQKAKEIDRTAIFLFFGIFLHNFPEGMAIGMGGLSEIKFSIMIAIVIAIHDIPEAVCVAAPLYFTNKKRFRSFFITLLTAIPTVIGFLLTHYYFKNISASVLSVIIGATAGVMIHISFFELLPQSFGGHLSKKRALIVFLLGGLFVIFLQGII